MQKVLVASRDPKTKSFTSIDNLLVTLHQKLADPNTGVRESEFSRIPNSMALRNRIDALTKRVSRGGVLSQEEREELVKGAKIMLNSISESYTSHKKEYLDYANQYGVPSELVIGKDDNGTIGGDFSKDYSRLGLDPSRVEIIGVE